MQMPQITIIIPVYNVQEHISRCITSIKNQTYVQFECILVDDGSKDDSKQIIQDTIKSDIRFKYIYQKNGGPSSARNRGIEEASGEFLVFVDADDYVEKNYLKKLYESIKGKNDLVCCGYKDISKYGTTFINDFLTDNFSQNTLIECVLKGTGGVLWGKIFKTNIIKENTIEFDEKLFMSEDMVFILEYLKFVKNWDVIDEALYCYNRLNEMGISRNINYAYIRNYINLNEQLKNKLLELNNDYEMIEVFVDKRMYRFIYQSIVSEVKSHKSLKEKKKKIRDILSDTYLKKYIKGMKTNIKSEKMSFIFIKRKMIFCMILYIWIVEKLKKYKGERI